MSAVRAWLNTDWTAASVPPVLAQLASAVKFLLAVHLWLLDGADISDALGSGTVQRI